MEAISKENINNAKYDKFDFRFCFKDIKRFLIERFLYDNDAESLSVLLNIYNVEDNVETICPTYISLKHLKKDILKFLKHKDGKEFIAQNLSNLIHDDINRFELFLYLEGYRAGFNSIKSANKLEIFAFKYLGLEDVYNRKKLFNYERNNLEVLSLKEQILRDIRREQKIKKYIKDIVFRFNLHLIKRKIYNLNSHVDKQIMLNFDIDENNNSDKFKEINSHLSKKELHGLNTKIVKFLYLDGMKVFENAFWDGVNDKVMKRYK